MSQIQLSTKTLIEEDLLLPIHLAKPILRFLKVSKKDSPTLANTEWAKELMSLYLALVTST